VSASSAASRPRAFDSPLLRPVGKPASGLSTESDHPVRIGMVAPSDIVVDREEVHPRKQREQAAPEPLLPSPEVL